MNAAVVFSFTSNHHFKIPCFVRGRKLCAMEKLEFKIYPDGRVEELVSGVKGSNCKLVTEEINKQLGKVISERPTEEMYENELTENVTVEEKNKNNISW